MKKGEKKKIIREKVKNISKTPKIIGQKFRKLLDIIVAI